MNPSPAELFISSRSPSSPERIQTMSSEPELTSVPSPVHAAGSGVDASSSGPAMTRLISSPNSVANSKSRSSCPGTAMIAPVPYSIST